MFPGHRMELSRSNSQRTTANRCKRSNNFRQPCSGNSSRRCESSFHRSERWSSSADSLRTSAHLELATNSSSNAPARIFILEADSAQIVRSEVRGTVSFSDPIRQQKMDSGFGIPKSDRLLNGLVPRPFPPAVFLEMLIYERMTMYMNSSQSKILDLYSKVWELFFCT